MLSEDYYAQSATGTVAYSLGRGARTAQVIAQQANALKAAAAVGLVWGSVCGFVNLRRYKKGRISKRYAITGTANEAVGGTVCSALGLVASDAARTMLLTSAASSVIPFVVGFTVTAGSKILWDCTMEKSMYWCDLRKPQDGDEQRAALSASVPNAIREK